MLIGHDSCSFLLGCKYFIYSDSEHFICNISDAYLVSFCPLTFFLFLMYGHFHFYDFSSFIGDSFIMFQAQTFAFPSLDQNHFPEGFSLLTFFESTRNLLWRIV